MVGELHFRRSPQIASSSQYPGSTHETGILYIYIYCGSKLHFQSHGTGEDSVILGINFTDILFLFPQTNPIPMMYIVMSLMSSFLLVIPFSDIEDFGWSRDPLPPLWGAPGPRLHGRLGTGWCSAGTALCEFPLIELCHLSCIRMGEWQ